MSLSADHFLKAVPDAASIRTVRRVGGGCISEAYHVEYQDHAGRSSEVFVKQNREDFRTNFACERDGLSAIERVGVVQVPRPIGAAHFDGKSVLALRWIRVGSPGPTYFANFGRLLAQHHAATRTEDLHHGWHVDNFLGASPQPNQPCSSWTEFFATQRLDFQLRMAVDGGLADPGLRSDVQAIIDKLDDLSAGRIPRVSLLHGDLWSGNYLCDEAGGVVLIDPAVYRGCAEAEFGMIELFGACPRVFYESYLDANPLGDRWRSRVKIYVLYHLLNHLNLFGRGYAGQCRATAAEILRA